MHDKLCFVQFLHPGREHHLAAPGTRAWTTVEDGHGRKFLRSPGRSLQFLDASPTDGELGFWGEWEAPSQAEPVSVPVPDGPLWIHRPFWSHQASYRGLHNTDPFVFGDRFHYTGCLQHTRRGPTQLHNLCRGSVILFGSKRPGRPEFTLDTVFVVADYVDHTRRDYERKLAGVVSETYAAVTLGPWNRFHNSEVLPSPAFMQHLRRRCIGGMPTVEDGEEASAWPRRTRPVAFPRRASQSSGQDWGAQAPRR